MNVQDVKTTKQRFHSSVLSVVVGVVPIHSVVDVLIISFVYSLASQSYPNVKSVNMPVFDFLLIYYLFTRSGAAPLFHPGRSNTMSLFAAIINTQVPVGTDTGYKCSAGAKCKVYSSTQPPPGWQQQHRMKIMHYNHIYDANRHVLHA